MMRRWIIILSVCLLISISTVHGATPLAEGENDFGLLSYGETPKTWTINLDSFEKVEVGVYTSARAEVSRYGGWYGYLKINGEKIWEHTSGSDIMDHFMGQTVTESDYRNQYYDLTSKFHTGENTITYFHYTGDGEHGIKVKLTGGSPTITVPPTTTPAPTTTSPVTTSPPKTQPQTVTGASTKSNVSGLGWIFLIVLVIVVAAAFLKKEKKPAEPTSKPPEPRVEAKEETEIRQTFIEEEKTTTTERRKIPVFISKKLPSKCPSCGSPFKGKSGDACDYCGSIIREEEKINKAE